MIPVAKPFLGKEELEYVTQAVRTGWISSQGKFITEFEQSFANFCSSKHAVASSNGTVALHLALAALNISPGDEVIIPDLTFIATANVVKYCQAKPVFVDSEPNYWCMDPQKVEKSITKKTKAIIPVHVYGHPCDMDPIMEIAQKNDLLVIEDCAEAQGAKYKGKDVGSFGQIGCFSFYANKILTTGEGGMCTTSDDDLAEKMRILRDHGKKKGKQYVHEYVGFNYRMTNMQAAIGLGQMQKALEIGSRRDVLKKTYDDLLRDAKGIALRSEMSWAKSVCWMYSVLLTHADRNAVMSRLEKAGIDSRPLLYPMHMQPIYKCAGEFPVSRRLSESGITLPSYTELKKSDIQFIVKSLIDAIA